MTKNRDRLDDAIDLVTARMTNVEKDEELAFRIAQTLPERSAWSLHWLMPRLAVTAVLAMGMAVVVLRTFDEPPTVVGPAKAGHHSDNPTPAEPGHHSDNATPAEPGHHSASVEPRGVSVESAFRRTDSGTKVDHPDHEFSLPAIATALALDVDALTPSELVVEPALVLAPLVIADLPLSSEFSPR